MPLHLVDLPNSIPQLGEGECDYAGFAKSLRWHFLLAICGNFLFDRLELHLLNCIQKNPPPPPTNHSARISEPLSEPAAASWGLPP